jgi:translation initiation factor 2B subunit (eIF-2B alpha/beta/delta family)
VTEWRQWPSWRRLAAIARAPISGPAAAAGSLAAGSLADFVEALEEYAPAAYPEAVQEIADLLLDQQPSLAPVVALVNEVYLRLDKEPAELAGGLRDMERRMAESAGVLSAIGAPLVEEGSIVLTHGASGSVQDMLVRAAEEKRFFVACAATMPLGEGIELAADLAGAGLAVEVVPDDQVEETLLGVDQVLVGANAFGPEHVMNTMGSAAVAREAALLGVPFNVVASLEKALPAPLFERAVRAGIATGRFEPISLDRVTTIITETGALDPDEAGRLAATREVSADLLSRL